MVSNEDQAKRLAQWLEALDRYGADFEQWPARKRSDAAALLADSDAAQRAWRSLRDIEQALQKTTHAHRATPGLAARIVANAQVRPSAALRFSKWLSAALWRPALAGVFTLLIGGVVGWSVPQTDESYELASVGLYPWLTEDAELLELEEVDSE